jgi:hypothetical protein
MNYKMGTEDADRLYQMMSDLRESVEGYRTDLNGRLRRLEASEARRDGIDNGRGSIFRIVAATAAVAGSVTGVIVVISDKI